MTRGGKSLGRGQLIAKCLCGYDAERLKPGRLLGRCTAVGRLGRTSIGFLVGLPTKHVAHDVILKVSKPRQCVPMVPSTQHSARVFTRKG